MRILVLSQYCFPEPDLKSFPLAQEFKKNGFDVEILTGYPSHPIGKLYKGYSMKLFFSEHIEGIKIIRVPLFIDHSKSAIKRALNYLSFALSASILGIFLIKKHDIIYAYHAPATIAIPAILFKLFYRSKIFYDINDYWPDTISSTGMLSNKILLKIVAGFCKLSYRYFDNINVVSQGYKEKLLKQGVSEKKISLIYNWSLPIKNNQSKNFEIYEELMRGCFSIVYAGNIGKAQCLEVIINTALLLKSKNIFDVKFFIVGFGIEKETLENQINILGLHDSVILTGSVPADNVGKYLEAADALFLHLKGDPLYEITIPSKLCNYLCIGKPILCGVKGEAAKMVQSSKSGYCFEPENHIDLFEKILLLKNLHFDKLHEMGINGVKFFDENLSFKIGSNKMIKIFENLHDAK